MAPSYSFPLFPVLSPIMPILAFQIAKFLLGLRQPGRICFLQGTLFCTSTSHLYAATHQFRCLKFLLSESPSAFHPDLWCPFIWLPPAYQTSFPIALRGRLLIFLFLGIPRASSALFWGGVSWWSIPGWYLEDNIFPPYISSRYQKREEKNSPFCAPSCHKTKWQR